MAIVIECGNCKKRYSVDDATAGKKVKCRNCATVFQAAAVSAAASASVAGRSVSVAGASMAGKSVAGAPAAPAKPPRPAPPPPPEAEDPFSDLSALADLESGGAAPAPPAWSPPSMAGGRRPAAAAAPAMPMVPFGAPMAAAPAAAYFAPRPPTRKVTAVGVDSATPWMIILYLVANVALLIYMLVKGREGIAPLAWTIVITQIVAFFAVIGPLVLLGVFIGSKILRFPLQDAAYLRSCGIGAVPGVMSAIAIVVFFTSENPVAMGLIGLAALPLFFYVMKHSFDLTWGEAAVSFAFTIVFYGIAQVLSVILITAVAAGAAPKMRRGESPLAGPGPGRRSTPSYDSSSYTPSGPVGPAVDPDQIRLQNLRAGVQRLLDRRTVGESREGMLAELSTFKTQVEAARPTLGGKPGWDEIPTLVAAVEQKYTALPSEQPDPAVFKPLVPTASWDAPPAGSAALAPEVSFQRFKLRPPLDAPLALTSSETDANGLVWNHKKLGGSKMSVKLSARADPKQMRPWVATQPFMMKNAQAQKLFAIEAENATVEAGTIGGIAFTRIANNPSSAARYAERWVLYVALDGNDWVVIDVRSPGSDAQAAETFEAAARTLRKTPAGEPRAEPFAPDRVAPRLADDPEHAATILRRHGAAAEAAVAAQLAGTDVRARREAAKVLADIGTPKSAAALTAAAADRDGELVEAARAALRRIAPTQFDAVTEALMDLKAERPFKKKESLEALAKAKPDPARRVEVATLLENLLINDKFGTEAEPVARALAVWYTDKTAGRLVPMLTKEHAWFPGKRKGLMIALAATRDKRAVLPIMDPWLVDDAEAATAALIQIGQPAEDELIRLKAMWHQNAKVRTACARVLEQIGTGKCVADLQRASKDPRDALAASVAQQALETVKQRMAAPKPAGTKPGP